MLDVLVGNAANYSETFPPALFAKIVIWKK